MTDRWRAVIGLLLSAAVIAYILSTIETAEVWSAIVNANIPLLIVAALIATLCFPLRALRWLVILHPVDPTLSLGLSWRATAVGFAINNLLPVRLGEVARAYAVSREAQKISFPAAFASLAVDRAFDAVVLISFLFIGMLGLPAARNADAMGTVYVWLVSASLIASVLVFGLFALAFFPSRIIGLYQLFTRRLSPALEAKGSSLLGSFASGLSVLRNPMRFLAVLAWTIAHWLLNALAFWIGFKAVGLEASYLAAMFTQTVIAIAIATPQGPGYIGAFQFAAWIALQSFGVEKTAAYAWGFSYWGFSFIPITSIGMFYFARMRISLKGVRDSLAGISGRKGGAEHAGSDG